jgi:hypothetical protein
MEFIKKRIQQIMTTGTTTGCTDLCRIIVPNLDISYYFKISLTSEVKDIGFFDAFQEPPYGSQMYGSPIYGSSYYGNNVDNLVPIGLNNLL